MTVEDILIDLVQIPGQTTVDPGGGGAPHHSLTARSNLDSHLDRLLRAFETECQSRVRKEGTSAADHFTGLLCAILAAEILMCYCATAPTSERNGALDWRLRYRKCLSSLYSEDCIGFIVCNPSEVAHLGFSRQR